MTSILDDKVKQITENNVKAEGEINLLEEEKNRRVSELSRLELEWKAKCAELNGTITQMEATKTEIDNYLKRFKQDTTADPKELVESLNRISNLKLEAATILEEPKKEVSPLNGEEEKLVRQPVIAIVKLLLWACYHCYLSPATPSFFLMASMRSSFRL